MDRRYHRDAARASRKSEEAGNTDGRRTITSSSLARDRRPLSQGRRPRRVRRASLQSAARYRCLQKVIGRINQSL